MEMTFEQIVQAMKAAESFIGGFEDDETQEGIPEMLTNLRTGISNLENLISFIDHSEVVILPKPTEALERLLKWIVSLSEQSDANALDQLSRLRMGHVREVEDAHIIVTKQNKETPSSPQA